MQTNRLHLSKEDYVIFEDILNHWNVTIYAFGSRIKQTHQPLSDIDLCIIDPISDLELDSLKAEFEESDLPMKVDIKRKSEFSEEFFDLIKKDLILIKSQS